MIIRGLDLPFNSPPNNLVEVIELRLVGERTRDPGTLSLPAPTADEDAADILVDLAAQSDDWRQQIASASATLLSRWVQEYSPFYTFRSAAMGELCYLAARVGSTESLPSLGQLVRNRRATGMVAPGEDLRLRALRALVGLLNIAGYANASQYRELLVETLGEPRLALVSLSGLIGLWPDERENFLARLPDQVDRADLLDVAIAIAFPRQTK